MVLNPFASLTLMMILSPHICFAALAICKPFALPASTLALAKIFKQIASKRSVHTFMSCGLELTSHKTNMSCGLGLTSYQSNGARFPSLALSSARPGKLPQTQ